MTFNQEWEIEAACWEARYELDQCWKDMLDRALFHIMKTRQTCDEWGQEIHGSTGERSEAQENGF